MKFVLAILFRRIADAWNTPRDHQTCGQEIHNLRLHSNHGWTSTGCLAVDIFRGFLPMSLQGGNQRSQRKGRFTWETDPLVDPDVIVPGSTYRRFRGLLILGDRQFSGCGGAWDLGLASTKTRSLPFFLCDLL